MAQSPDWKQFLEAGMQFTAMTRTEAQRRARELVREGQLAQERVQSFVEELLETSRKRADELVEIVRHEVERQLKTLGITPRGARKAATQKSAKKSAKKKAPAKKASTKQKTGPKKPAKKKAPAKKASAKSTTKKSP